MKPSPSLIKTEFTRVVWIPFLCALAAPVLADTVIVESRSGGQNYSAYSEPSGSWGNSSAKSLAPGCSGVSIGSRYCASASPVPSFTVSPTLAVTGGVYSIDVTFHASACPDIVVNVTANGGTLSTSSTTAFRNTGYDTWKAVGTITLSPTVNNPTITFTYASGALCGSAGSTCGRFYSDAVQFINLGDPCLNALPQLGTVNGPLAAGQTYVDVPGVTNTATEVYVYADGVKIGSLTNGVVGGTNRVPTSPLVQGKVITVTQSDGTTGESCRPNTGPIVGAGPNTRLRVALSIRQNTSLSGPIGTNGGIATAPLKFLGASGVVGGGYGNAPSDGKVIYPGRCWQTVSFQRGTDLTYAWANSDGTSNILGDFGVLESIAFAIDDLSNTGPYRIFIDNIVNGSTVIQDFEAAVAGDTNVLFTPPSVSGSTAPYLLSKAPGAISPNIAEVSNENADTGMNSVLISWQFKDCSAPGWLRLLTQNAVTPNPEVDLRLPISFRILLLPVGQSNAIRSVTAPGPTNTTVGAGSSVTLSAAAAGDPPLTYRWLKGGVELTGETAASLTIPGIGYEQGGFYTVEVTGPCNSVTNTGMITVVPAPAFAVYVYDPQNNSFSVVFDTRAGLTYYLEYKDDLTNSSWTVLQSLNGEGYPGVFTDELTNRPPTRFYRLRAQ